MSARINLLPHREERRKRSRQHFYVLAGGVSIIGILIVAAVHGFYASRIETQIDRNRFLKSENIKLDKEIAEIQKLKDEIQALLARKQVIETLQADRATTVYMLDQLVRQMPEGVYLKGIKQTGTKVMINGYTQSQARVSTLMRNLESSPHLEQPSLVEIKAAQLGAQRMNEFTMNINIRRAVVAQETPGSKPAAKR